MAATTLQRPHQPGINEIRYFRHRSFFMGRVNPAAEDSLFEQLPFLSEGLGAIAVSDFLNEASLDDLNRFLELKDDRHYKPTTITLGVQGLVALMSDLSSLSIVRNELTTLNASAKKLGYTPSNPQTHSLVPPHHDFKDGNAVLYNWNVTGQEIYRLGAGVIELENNQLLILNGESTFLPKARAHGTIAHAVQAPEGLSTDELEHIGRDRLLVYWDGVPTDVTMLAPEV